MNRKQFISLGLASLAVSPGGFLTAQNAPKPPALSSDLVKEFVGKAHNNLDRVKELLAQEPNLLNACWDWGGGDFETALNAAGHVGDRDIATFLLEKGARADIFVLTMLGRTALVKSMLEAFPSLLRSAGPHGYTLLHHAKRGGEPAAELLEFLTGKGLETERLDLFKK
jgi:ankyrin repeat protein